MENQLIKTESKPIESLFDKFELVHKVINQTTTWNVEAEKLQNDAAQERKAAKSIKKFFWFSPLILILVILVAPIFILAAPIVAIIILKDPKTDLSIVLKQQKNMRKSLKKNLKQPIC